MSLEILIYVVKFEIIGMCCGEILHKLYLDRKPGQILFLPASLSVTSIIIVSTNRFSSRKVMQQQFEAHAQYLQNFFPRFFEHIDPESGPVKGIST